MRIPGFYWPKLGAAWLTAALLLARSEAAALTLDIKQPWFDMWSYPFATSTGDRVVASTFGAIGSQGQGFDNRDAQFYFGFSTAGVPTGQPLANYNILSVTLTLTISSYGKIYDPTYDPISTYGPNGEQINGDDVGRPMELYGVGYRNGVTSSTVNENTPYSTSVQPSQGTRSVYATDFAAGVSLNGTLRDVSNNVTGKGAQSPFDPKPFAIGQVAAGDLSGNEVDADAKVTFTLDLTNADVLRYLQLSLQAGKLVLAVTSLDEASRDGDVTYPVYYTKENLDPSGAPPQIVIQVAMVPEPSAVTLTLCGIGLLAACWRGGRALRGPNDLP